MTRHPLALLLALPAMVFACSGGDTSGPSSSAQLRVVAGVTGTAGIDVLVDDAPVASGLANGQYSPYRDVPSGARTVKIRVAGTNTVVRQVAATFEAGKQYTVVPVGPIGAVNPLLEADTGAVPAAGMTKVRAIHAAPNAPALEIHLTQPDFPSEFQWVFPYAFESVTNYQQSTAGNWRVRLKTAGGGTVLLDAGPFALTAGQVRTVVILDDPAGGLRFVVLADRDP